MADVHTISDYLVSLGFETNSSQFAQFNSALGGAATNFQKVTSSIGKSAAQWQQSIGNAFTAAIKASNTLNAQQKTNATNLVQILGTTASTIQGKAQSIAFSLLGWQTAITGVFAAVTGGVITLADKVAQSDLGFKKYALSIFSTEESAKRLRIAQDALGEDLGTIAFMPELRERFIELEEIQTKLQRQLGPQFENNMRMIRDIRQQFTLLDVTLQYLASRFVSSLFSKLGVDVDGLYAKLSNFVNWFSSHIDVIGDKLADYALPILQDFWQILKSLGGAAKDFTVLFANVLGMFTGTAPIEGATDDFSTLGKAIQGIVHDLAMFVQWTTLAERMLIHFADAAVLAVRGDLAGAKKELAAGLGDLTTGSGGVLGFAGGSVLGAGGGALAGGILGAPLGPLGIGIGASIGAAVGGFTGGAAGTATGAAVGQARERLAPGAENTSDTSPLRATEAIGPNGITSRNGPTFGRSGETQDNGIGMWGRFMRAFSLGNAAQTAQAATGVGGTNRGEIVEAARQQAIRVGQKTGLNPSQIFDQWAFETGGFSKIAAPNNLAGIRMPGGGPFQQFGSLDEFGDRFAQVISLKRYKDAGVFSARNNEEYAAALARGHYYTDQTAQNYAAGMNRYDSKFGPATGGVGDVKMGDLQIATINVNVPQTNATPQQIHRAVSDGVWSAMRRQNQINMAQLETQAGT